MPSPIPFADDGGTPAWRARHASPPALRFPIWRFLLALAALPFLLAFMAAASWLAWMCLEGVMGPPCAVPAAAAFIRRHTGMQIGMARCRPVEPKLWAAAVMMVAAPFFPPGFSYPATVLRRPMASIARFCWVRAFLKRALRPPND
jgi:hypothetical protein